MTKRLLNNIKYILNNDIIYIIMNKIFDDTNIYKYKKLYKFNDGLIISKHELETLMGEDIYDIICLNKNYISNSEKVMLSNCGNAYIFLK